MRGYDDLTAPERKTISIALKNHAAALTREATKVRELGEDASAEKMMRQSTAVLEQTLPIFDDQTSLSLEEAVTEKPKRGRPRKND